MEQHKLQANRICCLRVFGLYPQIVLNRTWHEFRLIGWRHLRNKYRVEQTIYIYIYTML